MEINETRPILNLDLFEVSIIHWSLIFCYHKNMYTAQHLNIPSEVMTEKMNSTKTVLTTEKGGEVPFVQNQRKENILKSIYNAVANIVTEHVFKLPGSFMFNTNNPLSVTIVQNNGIISPEFFKGLMTKQDSLISPEVYTKSMESNECIEISRRLNDMELDRKTSAIFDTSNVFDTFNVNFNKKVKEVTNCQPNNLQKVLQNQWLPDCKMNMKVTEIVHKEDVSINNKEKALDLHNNTVGKNKFNENLSSNLAFSLTDHQTENTDIQVTDTGMLSSVWKKVMAGISDSFNFKTDFINTEIDHVTARKIYSPRQRKKINMVAKGRRRGRAKSQLRHSGVSQTRHRKERNKHQLDNDIQDELDIWEQSNKMHCNNLWSDDLDDEEFTIEETFIPTQITFADIKTEKRKVKTKKVLSYDMYKSSSIIYELQQDIDVVDSIQNSEKCKIDPKKNVFRPRLMSESSVDSEDSYCIVFESESESTYKIDFDYSEASESSDESQCENDFDMDQNENKVNTSTRKVTFDLKPVVHTMVQWDFAYRAARRGPWEEMARDRERFKGRIYCTKCILDPILEVEHRTHIWNERFA